MRKLLTLAFLLASTHAAAATDTLALQPTQLVRLKSLAVGERVTIDDFPDGYGGHARLRFERIDVYAPNARIVVIDVNGKHEVPRSQRIQLIGSDDSGGVRAHIAFDPGFTKVEGAGFSPTGSFAIGASKSKTGFGVMPAQEALPTGVVPKSSPNDDTIESAASVQSMLHIDTDSSPAPATVATNATIAIDTDNEFMSKRFSNNTSNATAWIADLFGVMNVMYQRDLNVTLVQGSTTLRTTADPYTVTNTPADTPNLNEFANYWAANEGAVPRVFAALLSGKSSSGNSASGIAVINGYCNYSANGGGYSIDQIFTNSQIAVEYSARIVGHELGHNFGAAHTHCTSKTSGAFPTSSNTIDTCRSGESMIGGACYSGPTSCPATGPGAPAGSIMSYCNQISCGSDHQNVLQFHPAQITTLSALIAAHTPSCLSATGDLIFKNGFD